MKKQLLLTVAGILFATTSVQAEGTKIGFINDSVLAQNSTALQGLQLQRDKMAQALTFQVEKEAAPIIQKKKDLAIQEKSMSRLELAKQIDAIEKSEMELRERAQKVGQELQDEFAQAFMEFKDKAINPVVAEIAKKHDFDAIIDSRTAFYMDDDLDVTKEAIKGINKKMPKIEMKKVTLEAAKISK